jgi:hypothetical protein
MKIAQGEAQRNPGHARQEVLRPVGTLRNSTRNGLINCFVSGHDRGTLWVACRKSRKNRWALAPEGPLLRCRTIYETASRSARRIRPLHPCQHPDPQLYPGNLPICSTNQQAASFNESPRSLRRITPVKRTLIHSKRTKDLVSRPTLQEFACVTRRS